MLNATEAKRLADTTAGPIIQEELEKINKCIKRAAAKGEYCCVYECRRCYDIREEIAYRLKHNYGYRAYANNLYPEINIMWKQ